VFHRVSDKWFRRTRNITELGLDYKEVGGCSYIDFGDVLTDGHFPKPPSVYLQLLIFPILYFSFRHFEIVHPVLLSTATHFDFLLSYT
jgi:hypothetical protein